jgi:hypothetical protein
MCDKISNLQSCRVLIQIPDFLIPEDWSPERWSRDSGHGLARSPARHGVPGRPATRLAPSPPPCWLPTGDVAMVAALLLAAAVRPPSPPTVCRSAYLRFRVKIWGKLTPCSFGLWTTSHPYFSVRKNQPRATSQHYLSHPEISNFRMWIERIIK